MEPSEMNALKPNDRIGICAPSARFDSERFNQGVHVLTDLGFKVHIPDEIFFHNRYLSGSDADRAMVVNRLFSDPKIDAVICARGGFGAMKILDLIDWDMIKRHPKLFIGYSDITALLLPLIDLAGISVIHGPNVVSLATAQQETLDSFYQVITGTRLSLDLKDSRILTAGRCTGRLKGGNLSTISHLIGTVYQPDFTGSVVFIEDIGEPVYKIDRMLTQLTMAGVFHGIKGVIIGSFEDCDTDTDLLEVIHEHLCCQGVPVIFGLPCGHGPTNLSLPMGRMVVMDTARSRLSWEQQKS